MYNHIARRSSERGWAELFEFPYVVPLDVDGVPVVLTNSNMKDVPGVSNPSLPHDHLPRSSHQILGDKTYCGGRAFEAR